MAATKPGGKLLEIGTGTGVGTCWLLDGMDADARLTTVETDPVRHSVARSVLEADPRVTLLLENGRQTIASQSPGSLDLIFADGGVGKHQLLDEALALLKPGGIYICDDTKPHPLWPPEHAAKIPKLMTALRSRGDFKRVYLDYSSGVVIMARSTVG
jgi:predicted O-methyltransferase YrrM